MLPLALILRGLGATIAGSDRSRDQGRSPEKFAWLESLGIVIHPQDGSGIVSADQTLVASAAVENSVPEVIRAKELGCPRMRRAELLAALFNAAPIGIAVGGTSGKSTVTGMIGWILHQCGRDPTIMNGAVMKNFVAPDAPFASARIGSGEVFVSEVDESDGSIALYRPTVAVLNNVSLDHKSIEELRVLFGNFLASAEKMVVNMDDAETYCIAMETGDNPASRLTDERWFGVGGSPDLTIDEATLVEGAASTTVVVIDARSANWRSGGDRETLTLKTPGRHNLSNALAAISAAMTVGVPFREAVAALASFEGLARRFDILGTSPSGITVIDDFGHNPDKIAATMATLRAHPGRIVAFFQPHGYGPLRQMGTELAQTLAGALSPDDIVIFSDPAYFGGTVDRSVGSAQIVAQIAAAGAHAEHIAAREDCGNRIVALARPGDRIVIMGARDDTLTAFAKDVLARLK